MWKNINEKNKKQIKEQQNDVYIYNACTRIVDKKNYLIY